MASIRTANQIQDNMSKAFQSMNKTMNAVLTSFKSLQSVSSQAIDTTSIQLARQELTRAETALNRIGNEIREVTEVQQEFNDAIQNGASAADELLQKFAGATPVSLRFQTDEFESPQKASGQVIDTASIQLARQQFAGVEVELYGIGNEIREANEAQQRLNDGIRNGTSIVDLLLQKFKGAKTAYLAFQIGSNIVELSDQMANTTARLNMMNDGLQTTAELQQKVFESAQRSYTPYQDTANLVGNIGLNAPNAFSSNDEIIGFSELLNKQFGIAGTNAEGVTNATSQLTQALSGGVLRGQELESIFKHAPSIIHTIADYLDVPIEKIRDMAMDGQITAEDIKQSMFAAADDINEKFDSMPVTFANIWTNLKSEAFKAFEPVLQRINDIANNEKIKIMIDSIVNSLYLLSNVAMGAFDVASSMASFMYDNWLMIEPIIWGVVLALIVYNAALGIAWLTTLKDIGVKIWHAIVTWIQTTATLALIFAQYGLNAALAACPITWILIGIIAIIAIFYAAVAAVNHFAGTSYSATGLIAGAFAVMGAFIANVFLGLLQIVFGVIEFFYNIWITFANFFGNVMNDPIGAIIHLFGDLADNVLGVIERIADALDFVFGSNLAGTVAGWRSELAGLVNWAAEEFGNGSYEVLYDELDIDSVLADLGVNLDRFEYKNAWDAGNDWGANLFKKDPREGPKEDLNKDLWNQNQTVDALGPLSDDGKKTADNTAKMATSMEGSEEDLKYLRDLAERDVINRFTTAEVKVDFSSTNTINSELDLDGIIDQFTGKLEVALDVAAEGV